MTQTYSSDLLTSKSTGHSRDLFPTAAEIAERAERLLTIERTRYQRLWLYFRNPMRPAGTSDGSKAERPYRQAQEWGLPARITGMRSAADMLAGEVIDGVERKEVVIENDIGWRVETGVDYLFGKPLVIESAANDPDRRAIIGELLREILASNGGILLLQQLATLRSVYGFVDVLVKLQTCDGRDGDAMDADGTSAGASSQHPVSCGTQDLGRPPAFSRAASPIRGGRAIQQQSDREVSDPRIDRPIDAAHINTSATSSDAESAPRTNPQDADPVTSDLDAPPTRAASTNSQAAIARLARMVRLEVVEPARVLPFLSPSDWREVTAYGQAWEMPAKPANGLNAVRDAKTGWLDRLRRMTSRSSSVHPVRVRFAGDSPTSVSSQSNDRDTIVELITPTRWMRYENGRIVAQGDNSLGRIPLVHIQNAPIPMEYAGSSDVEPLIPLQDELNTRLSDRACRITLQSFKMYLGRGIENFLSLPIAPGQMWMTDNEKADVIEFGGDASCPSEEAHISDIREAMDKTSGVSPVAAGAIKGRIGRLTSAAALRITLQALLARTEKKRTTYGAAIAQMCELSLAWLDRAGLFTTTPGERKIEINWSSPIPENEIERLQEAEAKLRLGVDRAIVLRELGY